MKPLLTRAASRALDADAIAAGVAGLVLMENAGRGAADVIAATHLEGRVVVVCGPGQNGGDGWVVARHLQLAGVSVEAVLIGDESRIRGDARPNLDAWRALGGSVSSELNLDGATLIVDALFGTGLARTVEGAFAEAVEAINQCGAPVVALDLPSGVDADTGEVLGRAVRATQTVTFGARKRGLYQHPGREYAGEIFLAHIGVAPPRSAPCGLLSDADAATILKVRGPSDHKGTAGHVLVVAGANATAGASELSVRGAFRAGAGKVTLAGARSCLLEAMTLASRTSADILAALETKQSLVLGPGLGLGDEERELTLRLSVEAPVPTVLDADALTHLVGNLGAIQGAPPRVLTPHPGEAARLLETSTREVQRDRYRAAATLADATGQVVILKGAGSIVASPAGVLRVCDAGTPALGVAGSGDVLAGMVGALLAQHDSFDAAVAATHWHARAGERAASDRGLLAHEIADALPATLESMR
ncbi:MAG: NAD(P)H-hydrate dehydratase [Myxococcota bacterium]